MKTEILDVHESSAEQKYATHGFHRFYGKLPPLVVKRILENCSGEPIVDIMCGSGTVLVESVLSGRSCIGVDINPLCVLISRVKTTPLKIESLRSTLSELSSQLATLINPLNSQRILSDISTSTKTEINDTMEYAEKFIPNSRTVQFWFEERRQLELGILKSLIDRIQDPDLRNFFLVAFSSIIRKVSKASPRVGKLFKTNKKDENIVLTFVKRSSEMINGMQKFNLLFDSPVSAETLVGDARSCPMKPGEVSTIFWHPPYLALYRYSAIYRLEIEWLGFNRKNIRRGEIEEGFKSAEKTKYQAYINDLHDILVEAYTLLVNDGTLVAVIADSSLRGVMLPVVSSFLNISKRLGFTLDKMMTRKIHFSQSVYHPSSHKRVRRQEDKVIFLKKTK